MLNIQEKISDSSSFDEIRKAYSNDFINRLCDNFNERWDRQASCASNAGGEENGESGSGILGKITAGIHAVSETIQDIVNISAFQGAKFGSIDTINLWPKGRGCPSNSSNLCKTGPN